MKKALMTMLLVSLSAVLVYSYADAKVSGICSNCHTMHNSQDGSPMTYDGSATPNGKLLRGAVMHRTPPVISSTPYPRFTIQTLRTLQEGILSML